MLRHLGLACLLLLVLQSTTAWAAPDDDRAGAEPLLQAFPLDPTGERVEVAAAPEPRGRSEAVRALPESAEAASGSSRASLVLATGIAAGLVLLGGGLVTVRRRKGPSRRGSVPLSQTGWPSTRQRILDYWEPNPVCAGELEPTAFAGQRHYPDILVRGRVRALELPAGEAPPAAPPPPVEWRSVA
jgi:hypothetical protein